ncbi:MAG: hypothetical protein ABI867_00210 [Kofleriaceae bacterium]
MHKTLILAATLIASASRPSAADCKADVDRVGKHLGSLKTPGYMPVIKGITVPTATSTKPIDQRGFVVAVTKDGKYVSKGQVFASLKEVEQFLDGMFKSALETWGLEDQGPTKDAKFALYIWADKDTPAKLVAGVATVATKVSDRFTVRLLVGGKTTPPAPSGGATAVAAKLPGKEPEGTKYLATELKKVAETCDKLVVVLATHSVDKATSKKKYNFVEAAPKAILDCGCKVGNLDVLDWGLAEWYGAAGSAFAWVDLPKLGASDAQPLGNLVK